uniref:E3 ubiquitin-protein ligase TTC3 n=1 Tax=Cacopsylla melanoneura TaxID=428564 RepID=A0A8D9DPZ2_9HEMI
MDFECLNNCPTPANDHIWFNSSGGRTPIRQDMSYNNYNNWDTLTADQYRVYLGWEKLKTASHDKLLAHLKNALSPKTEATTSSGRTESASSETGVQESKKQKKRRKAKESVLKKKRADSAGGESETQCESKAATAKEEEVVDERTKLLREFESLVRKGTEHYVKAEYSACVDVYKRVRKHYSELLRNMCAPRDRAIFTYIFCMSRIHTRSYEEITDSLHELKMDLPAPFPIPMKHYGIALAYQTLNRHDMVVQNTRVALTAISEVKKNAPAPGGKEKDLSCNTGDPSSDEKCDFCMLTPIPESNPDHLTGLLESLARSIPSIPVARCKYERCLNISTHVLPSQLIFETDPDFTGYVRVICEDQCSIEYHHQCWKAYKESVTVDIGVKTSDKEFLGKSCPTLDCKTQYNKPSTIVKINIYGADNEIKSSQTKPVGVGVIAIGGTHSGHSRKRDEDTEEGDRGKKKRNRVDSESSPMRGKSKKKETRKGNKEKEGGKTLEEGGEAKSAAAAAHQGEKVEEKIATPPPAPAAQPKKGKHRKVKFSCVESYNRPSNGPYKPGLPNQTKGATADKGKSWREKKSILGDLEAEVNLLEALRETKFGIPEEDWVDVSKDNFDNPQLVADKIHIDKYNRNPNDTEVLLFDMYRDYLKDSKQPVQILPPENRSHNFWNLSWTPGADIITNFDSIVISNKWKDVSRFLTSSPEFVIIDTDLCLVGHLNACVQLQIYDPDCSSEDEVLQYVHLTHEAVEKSSQDQQVLVQVQGVDETKIKNELALFGRVKQAVPYEAGFIVTFADKVGAAMAVKYSQREVKRICADPNHAACKAVAQSNTNMSQAVEQSNTNMSHKALNPDAKIFGFDDMAAKAINTREYQSVECEEVASETESVSEITSDNEDLGDEDDDDGSVGEMLDETEDEDERYEGVDLSVFELSGCENKLEMNENELRENENELGIIEKQNESSEDENKLEPGNILCISKRPKIGTKVLYRIRLLSHL